MSNEPDLIIANQHNQVLAVVEVKDRHQVNRYLAAEMYKRFRTFKMFGNPSFFLLVTRDKVSFWQEGTKIDQDLPVLEFTTAPLFEFYEKQMDLIAKGTLDFLVFKWLVDLTNDVGPSLSSVSDSMEFENFKKAIRGAQVRFGAR